MTEQLLPHQPSQSLIGGIRCIEAIAASPEPVGTRALARKIGFEPTRVCRFLRTLAHLGIVHRTRRSKYEIGPGMHVLSEQSLQMSGLLARAVPPLVRLHVHGHSVALGVLWRDHVSYVYHAEPGMPVEHAIARMGLRVASRSSIGLALLGRMSDAAVKALFRGRAVPGYADTGELLAALRVVRAGGYAFLVLDRKPYLATLAVALEDPPYAAIALAGTIYRKQVPILVADLQKAAESISGRKTG